MTKLLRLESRFINYSSVQICVCNLTYSCVSPICSYLWWPRYLLPMGHPSGRHSGDACNFDPKCKDSPTSVDYSNPDLERFPKFKDLQANEVILSPGDFLYLPTHWFHYIISLELNYQCNTRSGRENTYQPDVKKCGFR